MKHAHITDAEWTQYFLEGDKDALLAARIRRHAAQCAPCAALLSGARALEDAAADYAARVAGEDAARREDPYAAVASADASAQQVETPGDIRVELDATDVDAIFMEETLEARGAARQYAFGEEDGGCCLREDWDAIVLRTSGLRLSVELEQALTDRVQAELIWSQGRVPLRFDGQTATADVPANAIVTLALRFTA